jgi:hypothetical protein
VVVAHHLLLEKPLEQAALAAVAMAQLAEPQRLAAQIPVEAAVVRDHLTLLVVRVALAAPVSSSSKSQALSLHPFPAA